MVGVYRQVSNSDVTFIDFITPVLLCSKPTLHLDDTFFNVTAHARILEKEIDAVKNQFIISVWVQMVKFVVLSEKKKKHRNHESGKSPNIP